MRRIFGLGKGSQGLIDKRKFECGHFSHRCATKKRLLQCNGERYGAVVGGADIMRKFRCFQAVVLCRHQKVTRQKKPPQTGIGAAIEIGMRLFQAQTESLADIFIAGGFAQTEFEQRRRMTFNPAILMFRPPKSILKHVESTSYSGVEDQN